MSFHYKDYIKAVKYLNNNNIKSDDDLRELFIILSKKSNLSKEEKLIYNSLKNMKKENKL